MSDDTTPEWRDTVPEADDGYGSTEGCHRSDCDIQVVRPGKAQCSGEHDRYGCWHERSDVRGVSDDTTPEPIAMSESGTPEATKGAE